jgi:hypothetical protein
MLFAEQVGEGVVVDAQWNVYPATGEVFVYSPSGFCNFSLAEAAGRCSTF